MRDPLEHLFPLAAEPTLLLRYGVRTSADDGKVPEKSGLCSNPEFGSGLFPSSRHNGSSRPGLYEPDMRTLDRNRILPPLLPLLVGLACLHGCSWIAPSKKHLTLQGSSPAGPITVGELEDALRDLADRYSMAVAEACDRLKGQVPEEERGKLHHLKLKTATSVYDIVTSGDAPEELLDLLTLIELQNLAWIDEKRITRFSPYPGSEALAAAFDRGRKDAWELAERALDRKQLADVRSAILEWRRQNPDLQYMSFARFSAGTGTRGSSVLTELRVGLGGLLDPLSSTTESVDRSRELAAKAFFFAKRLPMLLEWEAEASAAGVAEVPAFRRVEQSISSWPSEGRSLILVAGATLAGVIGITFTLMGLYKGLGAFLARRRPAEPAQRPPTRLHPQS